MAGPNLPTTITSGVTTGHVAHTQAVHGIVNRFDTAIGTANSGNVLAWNGSVYAPAAPAAASGVTLAVESEAGVAVGNSGTTNRTNFNTWAAGNVGKPIFFRAGIYDFAGGQMFPKGSIFGAGPGVTVFRFPEMNVGSMYVSTVDNITLADFEIRSTSTATPLATGINSASSNHLTLDTCTLFDISNVHCNGAANMGIHVRAVHRGQVHGCRVFGTTRDGIHVTLGSTDVSVTGNQIHTTGDDGIALVTYNSDAEPNRRITVSGNTVSNPLRGTRGITIEGPVNAAVTGNVVTNSDGYGILINSIGFSQSDPWVTTNVTVAGNVVADANTDGIHINGRTDDVVIANNVIRSPGSAGLRILNGGRPLVTGNFFDNNGSGAMIEVTAQAANAGTVISNNVIRRARTHALFVAANNVCVNGNVIDTPNEDATSRAAVLFFNCSGAMATNNRVNGTSGRLSQGVWFDTVTGALVMGNYVLNGSAVYGSTGSSGILTS